MQWFGKLVSTTVTVFSTSSMPRSYLEDIQSYKKLMVQLWSVNHRATEAEESPLIRFTPVI
jgi:hypothetical protein